MYAGCPAVPRNTKGNTAAELHAGSDATHDEATPQLGPTHTRGPHPDAVGVTRYAPVAPGVNRYTTSGAGSVVLRHTALNGPA